MLHSLAMLLFAASSYAHSLTDHQMCDRNDNNWQETTHTAEIPNDPLKATEAGDL